MTSLSRALVFGVGVGLAFLSCARPITLGDDPLSPPTLPTVADGGDAGQLVRPPDSGCLFSLCGSTCTLLEVDSNNCGACGNACGSESYCAHGTCTPGCPFVICDQVCSQTDSDPMNCGGCGQRCTFDEVCNFGKCQSVLQFDGGLEFDAGFSFDNSDAGFSFDNSDAGFSFDAGF